jgi:phospho-N-acetylmuramoyl-pentapeptide-transferase
MTVLTFLLYGILSYIAALVLGPFLIGYFKRLSIKQVVREEGLVSHQAKTGTPTMGGFIFIVPGLCIGVLAAFISNHLDVSIGLFVFSTLGFGLIGFIDDYKKVVKKHNEGLSAKMKLLGQTLVALPITFYIVSLSQEVWMPFTDYYLDLGMFKYIFVYIAIIATTNAVNLTDGVDGLSTSVTVLVLSFYIYLSYKFGYLGMTLLAVTMVSALLGFLLFNKNPAKIFMGDVGSLALGGLVVAFAAWSQTLLLIFIVGIVYFIETLSVTLQVLYFKRTGKRIFKMSPLHHHFELCGWHEKKIVKVFSLITLLGVVIGILSLVWRQ